MKTAIGQLAGWLLRPAATGPRRAPARVPCRSHLRVAAGSRCRIPATPTASPRALQPAQPAGALPDRPTTCTGRCRGGGRGRTGRLHRTGRVAIDADGAVRSQHRPTTPAGDRPGATGRDERRYVLFGCMEAASCPPAKSTWSSCSTTPQPGCRPTAASRWRSGVSEITSGWRATRSVRRTRGVDKGEWLSCPPPTVAS
jgi:hypothetical protein